MFVNFNISHFPQILRGCDSSFVRSGRFRSLLSRQHRLLLLLVNRSFRLEASNPDSTVFRLDGLFQEASNPDDSSAAFGLDGLIKVDRASAEDDDDFEGRSCWRRSSPLARVESGFRRISLESRRRHFELLAGEFRCTLALCSNGPESNGDLIPTNVIGSFKYLRSWLIVNMSLKSHFILISLFTQLHRDPRVGYDGAVRVKNWVRFPLIWYFSQKCGTSFSNMNWTANK